MRAFFGTFAIFFGIPVALSAFGNLMLWLAHLMP